jgi:hypothetical protein
VLCKQYACQNSQLRDGHYWSTGASGWRPIAHQLQPPHNPVPVSDIGRKRLKHLFVGATCNAVQRPRNGIFQMKVTNG